MDKPYVDTVRLLLAIIPDVFGGDVVSFGASKPATHRRLKIGHQVGGTGWKNPLLRTCVQGVSVQLVPSVPAFWSATASPPRNRLAFPVGALAGFGPASVLRSAGRF